MLGARFLTALLFAATASVSAAPAPNFGPGPVVLNPPITYPTAGAVWHPTEIHTVTWDTSVLTESRKSENATLLLGYFEGDNFEDEHLDYSDPLVDTVTLGQGAAKFRVPHVITRETYIVALVSSTGQSVSPEFTIVGFNPGGPIQSATA
ncbi:hypothetical protein BDW22DRAFT_1348147 [Trametopsis cervina]|nr:hypothetical protein BDW22DRAFT_1348147 [Trametopsis cervina]